MKLILSTANIMSSGQTVVRRPLFTRSNVELLNGLRANFASSQHHSQGTPNSSVSDLRQQPSYTQWTTQDGDTLYIPSWRQTLLAEERESYDITVKLFFLPGIPASRRCSHTQEATEMVLKTLGVKSIDLLIVSFPGVSFDADDDDDEPASPAGSTSANSEDDEGLEAQIRSWKVLESLYDQGLIKQLGVSEFSADRLQKFLSEVRIRPTVNQINVKDCCVVPKDLFMYAKEHNIKLLTHNDCTDILPGGTTRQMLGPGDKHANILAARSDSGDNEPGLKGNIEPQWVVKYTAVVKDRGVVENKGYIASAQLGACVDPESKTAS